MQFHFGKPILVMIAIGLITGAGVSMRPNQKKGDLTVWVFADSHYQIYLPLIPKFEEAHHVKVNLNLITARAENLRLASLFMSGLDNPEIPDVAEVEIGAVGQYFRPPVSDVGFYPLNDLLKSSGWYDKLIQQRFAPWSKEGVIFGIPHDVHPLTITYREDLFREAGIDLSQAKTWKEFQAFCLQFQSFWKQKGFQYRHAMELNEAVADHLQLILLQGGTNLIDDQSRVHMADPKVARATAFYAQMVAGPGNIGAQSSGGQAGLTKDINEGNICAFFTPDWRVTYIKQYGAAVAGKMRMMPMPRLDPSDAPTSTWGGTMVGITRASKHKELAWELVQYLQFSPDALAARRKATDILPPIKSVWNEERYHQPDPFFGGQKSQELFVTLATQIPTRYVTPASAMASAELNWVLNLAVSYVREHGSQGLEEYCQVSLDERAADLQRRMDHWKFPE